MRGSKIEGTDLTSDVVQMQPSRYAYGVSDARASRVEAIPPPLALRSGNHPTISMNERR